MDTQNPATTYISIAALQSGDRETFARIFNAMYAALCSFAEGLIPDQEEAEEIAEDSFVKMWQHHHKFESLQHVKSFLYVTTRNKCYHFLEHNSYVKKQQKQLQQQPVDDKHVSLSVIHHDLLQQLSTAIEELPEQCRKVMTMVYKEGMKPNEVAKQMNVTASTVRNQQARGISLLKKRFSGGNLPLLLLLLQVSGNYFVYEMFFI